MSPSRETSEDGHSIARRSIFLCHILGVCKRRVCRLRRQGRGNCRYLREVERGGRRNGGKILIAGRNLADRGPAAAAIASPPNKEFYEGAPLSFVSSPPSAGVCNLVSVNITGTARTRLCTARIPTPLGRQFAASHFASRSLTTKGSPSSSGLISRVCRNNEIMADAGPINETM